MADSAADQIMELLKKIEDRVAELNRQRDAIDLELFQLLKALENCAISARALAHGNNRGAHPSPVVSTRGPFPPELKEGSTTHKAYEVLKEAGKPLMMLSELLSEVQRKHSGVAELNFPSGIYRLIKKRKVFAKYGKKIGLLEWHGMPDSIATPPDSLTS